MMTLGEWLTDEIAGVRLNPPWNPPMNDDYRAGYLAALREVQERMTARSRCCPLPQSE
jgi:hypothetical protein